ncbi:MAG: ABC transporter ATP-binding protein [Candidatus Binatia bacterium]
MGQPITQSYSALSPQPSVFSGEALSLDRVSFTYADAATPALQNVSLQVGTGEMVVLIGASGAGKSTLVKCLNRVIPAFQAGMLTGTVSLFGRLLLHEKVGELAGTIGMVFQDFEAQLFSTTVRDEIIFGMEQLGIAPLDMQQRLNEVLSLVGLSGFESRDPTTLSGGQKQRLAIAALLALRPQILVLDEPTTDLDPQGRQEIFSLLSRMRGEGHTLILVEHELSAAVDADCVVLLANGRVITADRPERLLPQVDLLFRSGVRPRDLDRLCHHFSVGAFLRDLGQAAVVLREHPSFGGERRCGEGESSDTHIKEEACQNDGQSLQGPPPPFLQLQTVSLVYPGNAPAVHEVSLSIQEGEFIALLGQNGSGKTTLAKMVSGLLTPSSGQVFLQGQELHRLPLHSLAQKVSYVFQNPDHQLFADTVEDEVAFGPRNLGMDALTVEARVQEALHAVGLSILRKHDPFLLGRGERQRLAVASLLALRPRLLILDEPTTGLDYPEQQRMMQLLRRLHGDGRTIIIITHVPWVAAEYAERALLMTQGHLVWDGPLRGLCSRPDLCARAAFHPPEITSLGAQFGLTPLSVEEFVNWAHENTTISLQLKADD